MTQSLSSESPRIAVRLFARAREIVQHDRVEIPWPTSATIAELRIQIAQRHPELAALLARSAIAVNHSFADDSIIVSGKDEIALIPPVSGG